MSTRDDSEGQPKEVLDTLTVENGVYVHKNNYSSAIETKEQNDLIRSFLEIK